MALPVATPVTTPAFVTVATKSLLLAQVPPDVCDNDVGAGKQSNELTVILATGKVLSTVTKTEAGFSN